MSGVIHFAGHISILKNGVRTLINRPDRGGTPVCSTMGLRNQSWVLSRDEVTCKRCLRLLRLHDESRMVQDLVDALDGTCLHEWDLNAAAGRGCLIATAMPTGRRFSIRLVATELPGKDPVR